MGKKYIIEIPEDKIADFVGSTHFLMPYMMAGHIGHHDTGLPIAPYTEPDTEKVRKDGYENGYENGFIAGHLKAEKSGQSFYEDGYQRGLNDAWEAARKICTNWVLPDSVLSKIFGMDKTIDDIMKESTASEAIEKIRTYEQAQKEKEEQIQVGDEVRSIHHGWTAVVSAIDRECMTLMDTNGKLGDGYDVNRFTKTGRHFPEIAEVLRKMKETDNG